MENYSILITINDIDPFGVLNFKTQKGKNIKYIKGNILENQNSFDGIKLIKELRKEEVIIYGNFIDIEVGDVLELNVSMSSLKNLDLVCNNIISQVNVIQQMDTKLLLEIEGIGKVAANKIVEYCYKTFGESPFMVLFTLPEEELKETLEEINLNEKQKHNFYKYIDKHKIFIRSCYSLYDLIACGFSVKDTASLKKFFEETLYYTISNNPFEIMQLYPLAFYKCDRYRKRFTKIDEYSSERISAAIFYNLHLDNKKGHLFSNSDKFCDKVAKTLNRENDDSLKKQIQEEIEKLLTFNQIYSKNNGGYYLEKNYQIENGIVEKLEEIISYKEKKILRNDVFLLLAKFEETEKISLNIEQKNAVYNSLISPISIICGGPGTGKTQVVKALNYVYERLYFGEKVLKLTAPTGKASRRLSEVTKRKSATIHKILGIHNSDATIGGYGESNESKILADMVVVDESSMIDASLFYKMLNKLKFGAQLVLVGDYNQLPSVGAGLILKDLIESDCITTSKLTKVYRQSKGSAIIDNSYKLLKGEYLGENIKTCKNPIEDFFIFNVKKKNVILYLLEREIKRCLSLGYTKEDIQVLTARKNSELGAVNINRILQDIFNNENETDYILGSEYQVIYKGDRVVQLVNNYRINKMNGETGVYLGSVVKKVNSKELKVYQVEYEDEVVEYEEEELVELSLAYAITVHKSQGSEFPVVFFIGNNEDEIVTNKNIIYTAWTRAKEKLYTIGDIEYINKRLNKEFNIKRNSFIKNDLIDYKIAC